MAKSKAASSTGSSQKMRPALMPEAREGQLVSLAIDLAEQQLRDGTASSQVITHYLKLGSTREKLDHELKLKELELMQAKTEALQSQKRMDELYADAIKAMRNYGGHGDPDEY